MLREWAKQGKASAQKELVKLKHPENELFFHAFAKLSAARTFDRIQTQSGVKSIPKPIPVSEIQSYCDFTGMNHAGQRMRLLSAIQAMDAAFIKFHAQ